MVASSVVEREHPMVVPLVAVLVGPTVAWLVEQTVE